MAIRYFKSGSTLWNSASSWATTVGGSDNAPAVPTALDDVIFNASSGSTCAITTTAGVCLTLTCTGYTGTITTNVTLTVSGNITLGASSVHSGTAAMICNGATPTLTSAGNANINCPFTFASNLSVSNTYTLADNWTFNGLLSTSSNAGGLTNTINGNNIFCKSGFTINTGSISSATLTTGTTVINMTGTGTILFGATAGGGFGNPFIINTLGTITMTGIQIYYRTGTFTYVKGTITGAWTLTVNASCTLDMNNGGLNYAGAAFNVSAAATITMLSDFYCTTVSAAAVGIVNGFSIYSTGAISISGTLTGTTVLRLKSSASGQALSSSGSINCDISFEAGANTITIGSAIFNPRSGGQSVTYTSGAVTSTGTLTVNGPNTITFNTAGMSWNNIIINGSSFTVTINSLLTALGTMSFQNQTYTFAGTAGFTVGTLSNTTWSTSIISLGSGNTYTVTTALNLYSTVLGTYFILMSGTPGSVAYLKLNQGASHSVGNIQPTDIDSSSGQTIWAWRPSTISNSPNWKSLTPSSVLNNSTFLK